MTVKVIKTLIASALAASLPLLASAQEYRLPGQHSQQKADLLAMQENVSALNLTVNNYINFDEEEEPELDIYTEGWDSKLVNCYAGVNVPQSVDINVANFCMPHPGYITSPYGFRRKFRRMHKGVDLKLNVGDTVRAAFDGRVRITNFERRGYGNYVVVRHTNDLETVYGHLSQFLVEPDQYVKAGEPIALGGNTGRSTGPHLHFETRYMGFAINPCAIFDFANQTVHTDVYTFDKKTYQNARNFDPKANAEYAKLYVKDHPNKPYTRSSSASASSGTGAKYYTVRKGDSLSRIATHNHTTVKKLCALNGISTKTTLKPGQKLKVR